MRVDVVGVADEVEPGRLQGATALVIDVLRASTSIIRALEAGCRAVVPVAEPDEARALAREAPAGSLLIAGERDGLRLEGFDLGNSPGEFTDARVRGRTVALTTSNGTRALIAARAAEAVGVAALVNASAAAGWAVRTGRNVVLLCAGEGGERSLEDWVCAGLLVGRMQRRAPGVTATAAAALAAADGHRYADVPARLAVDSRWARRLAALGHGEDVVACLRLDTSNLVPVYVASIDKVVACN